MSSLASTGIVAGRPLCGARFNGLAASVPSPEPLKGRLWQTNVLQDGSHETRRVFQVAASEGVCEPGRFSHLLRPHFDLGKAKQLAPTSVLGRRPEGQP